MRLSIFCANKYNISRRLAKEYIKSGNILIDKSIIKKDIDIQGNENVILSIEKTQSTINIEDYIIFKDSHYIFLYKPPFIHSERLKIDDNITISDIYKFFPDYTPLSRLDYEADGVIGMVKNNIQIDNLSKSYYAIVEGNFPKKITISKKIDADNKKKVKIIDDNNDGFKTYMENISYNGKYSLINVTLNKAARHQVRAFSSYLNHPILGDKIYNGKPFKRLCLHCYKYTINNKTILHEEKTNEFLQIYYNL